MMRSAWWIGVAVLGLLAGPAGQARGGIVTQMEQTVGFGGILLPDFDASLGSLIRAEVFVSVSGWTAVGSGGPSGAHAHAISFSVNPFSFSGSTAVGGGDAHVHSLSAFDSHTFSSPADLDAYFLTGSDVRLVAPTFSTGAARGSGGTVHIHSVSGSSLRFVADTTFTYEELAAVPEPSTLAGGLLGIALAGGAWLKRRRKAA